MLVCEGRASVEVDILEVRGVLVVTRVSSAVKEIGILLIIIGIISCDAFNER